MQVTTRDDPDSSNSGDSEELRRQIVQSLCNSGYGELRLLEIIVVGRDVCIRGKLSSYFLRQKAECFIRAHRAVQELRSEIDVTSGEAMHP